MSRIASPNAASAFCKCPGLQEHKPKIVVAARELRIAAHEFAEDVGRTVGIIVLGEGQSELDPGIHILGIKTRCVSQLSNSFFGALQLPVGYSQVVMRLRQIGIGHDGFLEFFEPSCLISGLPQEQSEAGVGLRIVRLQF